MNRDDPSATKLASQLARLCQPRRFEWPRTRSARLEQVVTTFEMLARCPDPRAIHSTAFGLGHAEPRIQRAAAEAARRLLPLWPFTRYPVLDQQLRNAWRYSIAIDPASDRQHAAARVDPLAGEAVDTRVAGWIVMASHPNGFVRQRAIEALAGESSASVLAAITLRLDDWVEPVRRRATELWLDHATPAQASLVIELLPLIDQMAGRERVDGDAVRDALDRLADHPEGRRRLLDVISVGLPSVARTALDIVLRLDPRPADWIDRALSRHDASIRWPAARALIVGGLSEGLDRHFEALASDPFTPIRLLALDTAEQLLPERVEPLLRHGLFDPSTSLRRRCQNALVVDFDVDPVPIYRDALLRDVLPRQRANALLGLSETGDASDRQAFEAHLDDPTPRVRAAAITGLAKVADAIEVEPFIDRLDDPSPRVCRALEAALRRRPWTARRFLDTFDRLQSPAGKESMLRLHRHLPFWERLAFLLERIHDADKANLATEGLRQAVLPRSAGFPQPTDDQRRAVADRLRFVGRSLPPDVARQLEFVVRVGAH